MCFLQLQELNEFLICADETLPGCLFHMLNVYLLTLFCEMKNVCRYLHRWWYFSCYFDTHKNKHIYNGSWQVISFLFTSYVIRGRANTRCGCDQREQWKSEFPLKVLFLLTQLTHTLEWIWNCIPRAYSSLT